MIIECKDLHRNVFDTLICVLKRENPSDKLIASVAATLSILHDRIVAVDKTILSQHVTDEEFEKYFEHLFTEFDLSDIEENIRRELGERDEEDND